MKRNIFNCLLVIGIILVVTLFSGDARRAQAQTRTVSWEAVTTYTDNTPIESANLPVKYNIYMQDNVTNIITQITTGTTSISTTFDDASLIKGRTYKFFGQAFIVNGNASDNSVKYGWMVPLGKVAPMGVITIN